MNTSLALPAPTQLVGHNYRTEKEHLSPRPEGSGHHLFRHTLGLLALLVPWGKRKGAPRARKGAAGPVPVRPPQERRIGAVTASRVSKRYSTPRAPGQRLAPSPPPEQRLAPGPRSPMSPTSPLDCGSKRYQLTPPAEGPKRGRSSPAIRQRPAWPLLRARAPPGTGLQTQPSRASGGFAAPLRPSTPRPPLSAQPPAAYRAPTSYATVSNRPRRLSRPPWIPALSLAHWPLRRPSRAQPQSQRTQP